MNKTSPSPSAETFTSSCSDWGGCLFVRFQTVSMSRLQSRKKKLPPPQKSSPGNTNLHLIRFFPWNCHRSIQYTDWSCDNRQNFKTQLFDLSDQACPKSLHQHHQRAGRVKGGFKIVTSDDTYWKSLQRRAWTPQCRKSLHLKINCPRRHHAAHTETGFCASKADKQSQKQHLLNPATL